MPTACHPAIDNSCGGSGHHAVLLAHALDLMRRKQSVLAQFHNEALL